LLKKYILNIFFSLLKSFTRNNFEYRLVKI